MKKLYTYVWIAGFILLLLVPFFVKPTIREGNIGRDIKKTFNKAADKGKDAIKRAEEEAKRLAEEVERQLQSNILKFFERLAGSITKLADSLSSINNIQV